MSEPQRNQNRPMLSVTFQPPELRAASAVVLIERTMGWGAPDAAPDRDRERR